VHVTYVRPRVLDDAQVVAVREHIEEWRAKAHKMLLQIEDSTGACAGWTTTRRPRA